MIPDFFLACKVSKWRWDEPVSQVQGEISAEARPAAQHARSPGERGRGPPPQAPPHDQ